MFELFHRTSLPLFVALGVFMTTPVGAETFMVPESLSLADAVLAAGDGDTISIASGTQTLDASLTVEATSLTIHGRTGSPGDVVIRTANRSTVIFNARDIVDFTVRDLSVTGSVLAFNISDSTNVLIENTHVVDNIGQFGAASFFRNSNASIRDSTFTQNRGLLGGALLVLETDGIPNRFQIERCHFSNNIGSYGGAIAVYGNPAPAKASKGFENLEPGCFSISDSIIEENTATNLANVPGYGGGILLSGAFGLPVSATLSNTTIRNCTATVGGGGLAAMLNRGPLDFILIDDCTFEANIASASHGGGILIFDGVEANDTIEGSGHTFFVQGSRFLDNRARLAGGGLASLNAPQFHGIVFQGNYLLGNDGISGGGACFSTNPGFSNTYTIIGNEFRGNLAERGGISDGFGGGLCMVGTRGLIRANAFYSNYARNGGGVALVGDESELSLNEFGSRRFAGNDSERGGSIFIGFEPIFGDRIPKVFNNTILDSRSFDSGGAMYIETKEGIPNEQALIANNVFLRNFLASFFNSDGVGEAVVFDGEIGAGVAFVHNTLIDHATRGNFDEAKGETPPPATTIHLMNGAEPLIANNIIANGSHREIIGIYEEGLLSPTVLNNAFFNVSTAYIDDGFDPLTSTELNDLSSAEGNLTADPLFEGPEGIFTGPYQNPHIGAGSPMIGAATDLSGLPAEFIEILATDFDAIFEAMGDPRPFGEGADIGADERGLEPTPTPTPFSCDVVEGNVPERNPRCDAFDLIILIQNQRDVETEIDTDFDQQDGDDFKDVFLFSTGWYQ